MAKNFKVGNRVVGKIKENIGWNGEVLQITGSGKGKRVIVLWENGKRTECTTRGIAFSGDAAPKKGDPKSTAKAGPETESDSDAEKSGASGEDSFGEERDDCGDGSGR